MPLSSPHESSASIGTTEYSLPAASTTLASRTEVGIYQVFLDLNALTASDIYRLKIKEKVRGVSTQRIVHTIDLQGVLDAPNYASPALHLANGWDVTLQKIAGTDRTIEWSIRAVTAA